MKRPALLLWAAASLCGSGVSCSGASGRTTDSASGYLLPDVASPLNAAITVEAENAASGSITATGGTLTATGSDGTVYTVTIPANALPAPTTITLTPIRTVAGLDFYRGRSIGARLEPEGLRFDAPITFRMAPREGERVHVFGFSAAGDGRELHGHPVTPDGSRLEMQLLHFSSYGGQICAGDCAARSLDAPQPHTPSEWEARLQNYLEWLLWKERERQLSGQPSDPTVWTQIEAVFREYWTRVIGPMLPRLMTDCSYAETDLWRAIAFGRNVELMGMGEKFAAQESQVMNAVLGALRNCFSQTAQPCIDPTNAQQITKLWSYTHEYAVLNNGEAPFDPRDPDLQCGRIWTGTSRVRFALGPAAFITTSASFVFEVDDAASRPGVEVLRVKSGSATWELDISDGGCRTRAGPTGFTLLPGDGEITLLSSGGSATFSALGAIFRPDAAVPYQSVCGENTSSGTMGVEDGTWLQVPPGTPAFPDGTGTMSGSISTGGGTTSEWSIRR